MKIEIQFADFREPLPPGLSEEKADILTEGVSSLAEGGLMSLEAFIARLRSGAFGDDVSVNFKTKKTRVKSSGAEKFEDGDAPSLVNEGAISEGEEKNRYWVLYGVVYSVVSDNAPASLLLDGISS